MIHNNASPRIPTNPRSRGYASPRPIGGDASRTWNATPPQRGGEKWGGVEPTFGKHLTHLERRLLEVHDRKLRHCHWCGQWAYGTDPCSACQLPARAA